jgi:phosphatidylserine decarboxylase
VCFEKDMINFDDLAPGMVTRLGEPMASRVNEVEDASSAEGSADSSSSAEGSAEGSDS